MTMKIEKLIKVLFFILFTNNVLAFETSLLSLESREIDYSENAHKFSWMDEFEENHRALIAKINELDKKLFRFSGERGSGGGGDIALCRDQEGRAKTYSLDYQLRDQEILINPSFYEATSCGDAIKKVHARLLETDEILAVGLKNFLEDFEASVNGNFIGRKRVFHFSETSLVSIYDERFDLESLKQCQVKQAAIRLPFPQFIHYSINREALNSLIQQPIQCSYLLLHEWARDFFVDAAKIRKFVHFLHSDTFFNKDVSLVKYFNFFKSADDYPPTLENYFKLVGKLGNLSFTTKNISQRLKSYEGNYKPLNKEDCRKSLRSFKNKVYISHLYNCSDPTEVMFECNAAECYKKISYPGCNDFELVLRLKGIYGHFSIGAKCDGKNLNLEHEYYHENQAQEFESFLKLIGLE